MGSRVGRTGVAVFWNVDTCPISENIDLSSIRQSIEAKLKQCGYCEPLTIHAYQKPKDRFEEAPRVARIDVINVGQGKETVEMSMLVDISILASGIDCPAIYMLISEDLDFAYLVRMLKERRYSFLLCQQNPRASKFFSAARHTWCWPKLLSDRKPLRMDEAFTSLAAPFTLIIWDFENCRLPRRVNRYAISKKIRVYLENNGYFGPVIIRAYGDTNSLAPSDLEALSKEIDAVHVDPGVPSRSLARVMWVFHLACAVLYCTDAHKCSELWLLPESVNFLLHCLPFAFMREYLGILKISVEECRDIKSGLEVVEECRDIKSGLEVLFTLYGKFERRFEFHYSYVVTIINLV